MNAPTSDAKPLHQRIEDAANLMRNDRLKMAERALRALDAEHPDDSRILGYLGTTLKLGGRSAEAEPYQRRAVELHPDSSLLNNNLGNILLDLDKVNEAIDYFGRAIAHNPRSLLAITNMGRARHAKGDYRRAIFYHALALEIDDAYFDALTGLANAHLELDEYATALDPLRHAIRLRPGNPRPRNRLAYALRKLGRDGEAIEVARETTEKFPKNTMAWFHLATSLRAIGQMDDAEAAYRKVLDINPRNMNSLHNLLDIIKPAPDDPVVAMLLDGLDHENTMTKGDRASLHFALARHYRNQKDSAAEFFHFQAGNAVKFADLTYDHQRTKTYFNTIRTSVNRDFLAQMEGQGLPTRRPVFVLGTPRSGTTLVEQIIHAHPLAFGAGELDLLVPVFNDWRLPGGLAFDEEGEMAAHTPRDRGALYIQRLAAFAPAEAERIVNKSPANSRYIGLIHAILPDSPIILCRRDPVANGYSCFQQLFDNDRFWSWTFDLESIGRYLNAYHELMDHWLEVLPPGRVLEVRYEALVADPEGESRRIIDYLDLPWNPACLDFHKAERTVSTASVAQVRKPIYTASVAGWRVHEKTLRPMIDAIGPEILRRYHIEIDP